MKSMSKSERVDAAGKGEPVDRPPISFWGHDYLGEWSANRLASTMLERHFKYGWDWMKLNPRAGYHAQVWGARYRPSGNAYDPPGLVDHPIKHPADLDGLTVVAPEEGVLGEQLRVVSLIAESIDAPFVQTVFSPLAILSHLLGADPHRSLPQDADLLMGYVQSEPKRVHSALNVITETFSRYSAECVNRGAAGIFFATLRWSSLERLDERTYLEFGRPYDLRVLEAVTGATLNILHLCGGKIMFDLLADYPTHVVNWDIALPGNPSLAEGVRRTKQAVMGGVDREKTLLGNDPGRVRADVKAALADTGGRRLLVSAGCGVSPRVPEAYLFAAKSELLC